MSCLNKIGSPIFAYAEISAGYARKMILNRPSGSLRANPDPRPGFFIALFYFGFTQTGS